LAVGAVVRPDGKILVDAWELTNPSPTQYENLVVQYNQDGTLDTSFGSGGSVATPGFLANFSDDPIALGPQGRIVVVGSDPSFSSMLVTEYNSDGSLNQNFGSGGIVTKSLLQGSPTSADQFGTFIPAAHTVAVDAQGRILVAGSATPGPGSLGGGPQASLFRFNPDGSLDKTFAVNGSMTNVFGSTGGETTGVAVRPNGQIVVAGVAGTPSASPFPNVFAVEQFNPDGSPDLKFGFDGLEGTTIQGLDLELTGLAIQDNGDAVVVGRSLDIHTFASGFAMARYTPDGNPDPGFGSGGLVTTFLLNTTEVAGVALETDGNIVVAGTATDAITGNSDFGVAEYLGGPSKPVLIPPAAPTGPQPPNGNTGQLNPAFGTGGVLTTSFGGQEIETGIAAQADGKIVAVGDEVGVNFSGPFEILVARYNQDGTLDQSFGSGGTVFTLVGAADFFGSVAIQSDGKIVVAAEETDPITFLANILVLRYNPDGSLDQSFGSGGVVTTTLPNGENFSPGGPFNPFGGFTGNAVTLTADGHIVVVGSSFGGTAANSLVIAEYDQHGNLEQHFGSAGLVTTPSFTDSNGNTFVNPVANAVTVDRQGRIVVAGTDNNPSNNFNPSALLVRYNADGSLDQSFGFQGAVTSAFNGPSTNVFVPAGVSANAVVIRPDGKIIVAGNASAPSDAAFSANSFAVEQYNPDGTPDLSFGWDAITQYAVPVRVNGTFIATSMLLETGGDVVVAGTAVVFPIPGVSSVAGFALIRLNRDGSFDQSFGSNGVVTESFPNPQGSGFPILLAQEPNGNIVAGGTSLDPNTFQFEFGLAEYFGGPSNGNGVQAPTSGPSALRTGSSAVDPTVVNSSSNIPAPSSQSASSSPQSSGSHGLINSGQISALHIAERAALIAALSGGSQHSAAANSLDPLESSAIDALFATIS
jgi:uncharacterized delta-60 repeat protein